MKKQRKPVVTIGRAELVAFPTHKLTNIPARIDTGARTSAIWASNGQVTRDTLSFTLFAPESPFYTGEVITTSDYSEIVVASSMGQPQVRYKVRLPMILHGRKMRASFTLADRSTQVYPVLIGRNILRGKFIVDVKLGQPLIADEQSKIQALQELLNKETKS